MFRNKVTVTTLPVANITLPFRVQASRSGVVVIESEMDVDKVIAAAFKVVTTATNTVQAVSPRNDGCNGRTHSGATTATNTVQGRWIAAGEGPSPPRVAQFLDG